MNILERYIHSLVEHNPRLRLPLVNAYQRAMSLIPTRIDKNPVTPNVYENCFFGFHDKTPFSVGDRYILCHRLSDEQARKNSPFGSIQVGIIDRESSSFASLGETVCWNFQQGSSAQWQGEELVAVYNDVDDEGNPVAKRITVTGERLPPVNGHISHISVTGKYAVGYNFLSLNSTDPHYGYPLVVGLSVAGQANGNPTLQLTRLEKDLEPVTLVDLEDVLRHPGNRIALNAGEHYFSHALISTDEQRIAFMHRCRQSSGKLLSRLYVTEINSHTLHGFPLEDVSHIGWDNASNIFAYARPSGDQWGYYELSGDGREFTASALSIVRSDGHPSAFEDWVITDTYPNRNRVQSLIFFNRKTEQVKIFYRARIPFKFRGGLRCDFHPRWSRNGEMICFDSAESGIRSLNIMPVNI